MYVFRMETLEAGSQMLDEGVLDTGYDRSKVRTGCSRSDAAL